MAKKIQLENGLKVILIENHKSPVVSAQIWVKTGSADEGKGQEGLSHFIEHLVFKGTKSYQVGEIASLIEGSGGELNAYTSYDQTVYYITISKSFVETAIQTLKEMVFFPLFDLSEIENEREVVIEEIKRSKDSLGRQASRKLFSTVYKEHPYRLPIIGKESVIKSVSRKKILDYFDARYVAQNMTLVVAGDFNEKEMKDYIKKEFSSFKKKKLNKVKREEEKQQTKSRIEVYQSKFDETHLYLAWPTPKVNHEDIIALDVLAFILGQGDSSRLVKRLRLNQPIVNAVGTSLYSPIDRGFFAISMSLNEKFLSYALEALREEVISLINQPPDQEELIKAIVNVESEQLYSLETVDGLARKFGYLEFLFEDLDYYKKYLNKIRQITPLEISKVAKKYLKPNKLNLIYLTSQKKTEQAKQFKKWIEEYSHFYQQVKINQTQESKKKSGLLRNKEFIVKAQKKGENQVVDLPRGAKVIFRKSTETPVISARAAFMGGVRVEPDGKEGLTELLSRVWTSGTKYSNEEELFLKMEKMATQIYSFSGRNTIGLSLETLYCYEEEARSLFGEILTFPTFPQTILDREKAIALEQIKYRNDNPAQIAIKEFMSAMFLNHPYAKDLLGTEKTVLSLIHGDLQSIWDKVFNASNLVISVAGNVNVDQWVKFLDHTVENIKSGDRLSHHFKIESLADRVHRYIELEKQQEHVIYGFRGLTFTDPDRFALQLVQAILAGQGGRLFLELRDKASLAYSVAPLRLEGIDAGYFAAYIACSPEKTQKAIFMIEEEFKKIVNQVVSDQELEKAKRYLIGRHDIGLQKTGAIASGMLFDDMYGVGHDEIFRYKELLQAVTKEDVLRVSQRLFTTKPVVILVGPVNVD